MTEATGVSQTVPPHGTLASPEAYLSLHDRRLRELISTSITPWPTQPTEEPIWGLVRIILAQQLSTAFACQLAQKVLTLCPTLVLPKRSSLVDVPTLRTLGIPERRAESCVSVIHRSDDILSNVAKGQTWEQALDGIKGIGPWTLAVFRIMVLRDPDVLPLGDVGLERAIRNVYGRRRNVQRLGEKWRPFRSVACWYLWRTLGNQQLG